MCIWWWSPNARTDWRDLCTLRYIELNPVRAGLAERPEQWAWSSARAHIMGTDDPVLAPRPPIMSGPEWAEFLGRAISAGELEQIRSRTRTGRPCGSEGFLERLESQLGRRLRRGKPGPKGPRKNG